MHTNMFAPCLFVRLFETITEYFIYVHFIVLSPAINKGLKSTQRQHDGAPSKQSKFSLKSRQQLRIICGPRSFLNCALKHSKVRLPFFVHPVEYRKDGENIKRKSFDLFREAACKKGLSAARLKFLAIVYMSYHSCGLWVFPLCLFLYFTYLLAIGK